MAKIVETKIVTLGLRVSVTNKDIEFGECRDPHRCMERLAILRSAEKELGEGQLDRVRIDGAQVKFNYGGYRWAGTTPKKAKVNLIRFDAKKTVTPHSYDLRMVRGTKIQKVSAERQHQINEARRARTAAGVPDKKRTSASLHQRVVGLGAV